MEGIQITVEKTGARQDVSVIQVTGYIDTTTSTELERVIQNLLREQRYKIIVDLQSVDYISSAGWGIFISEIKNIRMHRGDLKLANMSESVTEVYELLEFSSILAATKNVQEAIRLFGEDTPAAQQPLPEKAPEKRTPAPVPAASSAVKIPAPAPPKIESPTSAAPVPKTPPAPAPKAPAAPLPEPPLVVAERIPEPVAGTSLKERIRVILQAQPTWGAWRIKRALNKQRGALPKGSWGQVRAELKALKKEDNQRG